METTQLITYLDTLLQANKIKDYCPNGLQVEGKDDIHTIVTGVTACQALIDKAIELNADAILVHHGFFWKSEPDMIVGMKQRRIKALFQRWFGCAHLTFNQVVAGSSPARRTK